MKKHGKAKKGSAARSGKKPHKPRRLARKARKSSRSSVRKMSISKKASKRASKNARKARPHRHLLPRRQKPVSAGVSGRKAADEVPTLEQVTITCANCGRPFKVFKLKGLSLEGTICQRCSLGEMELPESFG
mgnify:CR=1 FL=1